MKKLVSLILVCLWAAVFGIGPSLASDQVTETPNVKIIIGGKLTFFERTTITINNRTLLPFRELLCKLGVPNDDQHIKWNGNDRSVSVDCEMGGQPRSIELKIGSNAVKLNGKYDSIDVAPVIYHDATYIPVRFVAQSLGKTVAWDANTSSAVIGETASYNFVKEILTKSSAAAANVKRYKFNSNIEMGITLGSGSTAKQMDISETKSCEFDLENAAFHLSQTMKTPSSNEEVKTETYIVNGYTYTNSQGSGEWKKVQNNKLFLDRLTKMSKSFDINPTDAVCAGLVLDPNPPDGKYLLKGEVYIPELFEPLISSDSYVKADSKYKIAKNYLELQIDKQSNLIDKVHFEMELSNTGINNSVNIINRVDITMSDYNGNFTVALPKEAENAAETAPNK